MTVYQIQKAMTKILALNEATFSSFKGTIFTNIYLHFAIIPDNAPVFESANPNYLYYTPNPRYTINGVTDWNTFGLLKDYKKKRQTQRDFEEELGQMETQIRDILSEITLELSEFYKDKTLPENITITVDVLTREATMTIDGKSEKPFSLDLVENEAVKESKKPFKIN